MSQKKQKSSCDISFIMPCHNDASTLGVAVEGILDQDLKTLEVVIVNDGSTDNTKEVASALAQKDSRVKFIDFSSNRGACVARNAGAKIAEGRYYSFLPADAFLYPGMARVWVETLDKHPDYDFLYGGYRFVEKLNPFGGKEVLHYKSEHFNPYVLESANYIDGSFPIRAEKFWGVSGLMNRLGKQVSDGLWDPAIKSLQDWDFWLSVVKEGKGKGIFYSDIFFETEMPHEGGLSYDSSAHWLERTDQIKRKHGIPDRQYCVSSFGASFHAKKIAQILDADYKEMPSFKPHRYSAIYMIGFYPEFADLQEQAFWVKYGDRTKGKTLAKKVVHLVGTDILQLSYLPQNHLNFYREFFKNGIDVVLTEDKFTQAELKQMGIESTVVPIPPAKLYGVKPLPKKPVVAVYMPATNKGLYQKELMVAVASELPDIQFKFFGDPYDRSALAPNIEQVGYIQDMERFISETSLLLRFPLHDGLSISTLEWILSGRQVVSSTPVKYTFYVKSSNKIVIANAVRKALAAGQNIKGSRYWRRRLSHARYKKTMQKILGYEPREHWERRAFTWDKGVGDSPELLDSIEPLIDSLKPKSVLDVGCGNGRFYRFFRDKGIEYRGIDISQKLIDVCKERYPDGKFLRCEIEEIPKIKKKFDLGFSFTVLQHIRPEDIGRAADALKSSCKKLLLIEPVNFDSRYYCYNHHYERYFNVIKSVPLGDKTLFVADNENKSSDRNIRKS